MRKGDIMQKRVTLSELDKYSENDRRVFQVSCKEDNIFKVKRVFMRKKNLRQYIEQPKVSDVQLMVCEKLA